MRTPSPRAAHAAVWLAVVLAATACDSHPMAYHQQMADAARQRAVASVLNSAVLLSRSTLADELRVDFAHRLLRVHDAFAADCVDSEWRDALVHKLCASYLRWEQPLMRAVVLPLDRDTTCALHGVPAIVHACRAHVSPAAPDVGYCPSLPDACADRAPLWGVCSSVRRGRATTQPTSRSHVRHKTRKKHASHEHSRRVAEHARTRQRMSDHLQSIVARSAAQRAKRPPRAERAKRAPRASEARRSGATPAAASVSVLYSRTTGAWDLARCSVDGRVVCLPRDSGALGDLREATRAWLRGCHVVVRPEAPVELLMTGACGAVVVWPPDAEAVVRDPCRGITPVAPAALRDACATLGARPSATRWVVDPGDHVYRVGGA